MVLPLRFELMFTYKIRNKSVQKRHKRQCEKIKKGQRSECLQSEFASVNTLPLCTAAKFTSIFYFIWKKEMQRHKFRRRKRIRKELS